MAKAVLVEQITEEEFIVWTNSDEPNKSVNDHCALGQHTVRLDWPTGIIKWMDDNGYQFHKDSDYRGPVEEYDDGRDFSGHYEP